MNAPALVIRMELEEFPVILVQADSFEDELRLRRWLRRARAFDSLREQLEDVLDRLDGLEEAA